MLRSTPLVLLLLAFGCASGQPPPATARFTFATTQSDVVEVEVLEAEVESEWCSAAFGPEWGARAYPLVVAQAIDRVPGADIMTNASFRYEIRGIPINRACVVVTGDVGRVK